MDSVPMEVIDIQLRNNIDVKKCFFQQMQASGSLPNRVDVRFTLEPTGNVSRAAITQAAFAGSDLDRCMSKAIKGITFPPTSGAATKITFPFIFE
jgi:TonB family protein